MWLFFFSAGGRRPNELQGLYECQVNTEPKINWPVTVHVEGKFSHATSFYFVSRRGFFFLFVSFFPFFFLPVVIFASNVVVRESCRVVSLIIDCLN